MTKKGYVRVSGGELKQKKIGFYLDKGVRCTLSRVKETMFDWLMFEIKGAVCLDLFAGSGSLGIEALSRGAKAVDFVDCNKRLIDNIKNFLKNESVDEKKYNLYNQDFKKFINNSSIDYNIIFLDPPYDECCIEDVLYKLQKNDILSSATLIVFEAGSIDLAKIEKNFNLIKVKKTKNLSYGMLKVKKLGEYDL
jgi:16S rRNA (guanine966-N2)-methyltransferase